MKAKRDELQLELSDSFQTAVHMMLKAELDMMRAAYPDDTECWVWGVCEIADLSDARALTRFYGPADHKPDGIDNWHSWHSEDSSIMLRTGIRVVPAGVADDELNRFADDGGSCPNDPAL